MSRSITATAPGKVVLTGEYAVLDGAPAVCMAINRRARAVVSEIAGNVSQVKAPGFSDALAQFQMTQDRVEWLNGGAVFDIVAAVLQSGYTRSGSSLDITLDTRSFIDDDSGLKIGIGSSAALTVAFSAAVSGSAEVRELARNAHKILQGASGSGLDIACSTRGGLIGFRVAGAEVTDLKWPQDLQFRLIWTGVAVSTVDKISQLMAHPDKPSRAALVSAAEAMAVTWAGGDASAIIENLADYAKQLRTFGIDHELGIFDAGHDSLWRAARAANLVYKPCGAGGGDVGIVFGRDAPELDAFVAALPPQFSVIDCALDPSGLRIEEGVSR